MFSLSDEGGAGQGAGGGGPRGRPRRDAERQEQHEQVGQLVLPPRGARVAEGLQHFLQVLRGLQLHEPRAAPEA